FILGDPKPEADVGNLARPITDVVSSPHSKRGMTVSGHNPSSLAIERSGPESSGGITGGRVRYQHHPRLHATTCPSGTSTVPLQFTRPGRHERPRGRGKNRVLLADLEEVAARSSSCRLGLHRPAHPRCRRPARPPRRRDPAPLLRRSGATAGLSRWGPAEEAGSPALPAPLDRNHRPPSLST